MYFKNFKLVKKTLLIFYFSKSVLVYSLLFLTLNCFSQDKLSDQKVFLITLDGLRWQELFTGADSLLLQNDQYVKHPKKLYNAYWRESSEDRRSILMPFVWKKCVKMGQIYGNRKFGSKVNLTNSMWFSYPGYNEILTGKADDKNIYSNAKTPNPNETVLEQFAKKNGSGRVAAFGSWDVFNSIVNQKRSGVYTNCGFETSSDFPLSLEEKLLNEIQQQIPSPWDSVRLDGFTHQYAKAYLKKHQPDFIFISYGETDDFAHNGDYESYLRSTKNTDALIADLWNYIENNAYYSGKTTFIITTDHGRGTTPIDSWRSHGTKIKGSDQTWIITFGNGILVKGELKIENQLYTNQIAPTIRKLFGLDQKEENGYGRPLSLN